MTGAFSRTPISLSTSPTSSLSIGTTPGTSLPRPGPSRVSTPTKPTSTGWRTTCGSPTLPGRACQVGVQVGRSFTITADQDAAVKREIQNLSGTAWTPYRTSDGIATDRQIAETVHTMNGTEQAFRLIVLRWLNPQPNLFEATRYCYHAVASNRQESASEVIWKHNGRGQCENWHKELKIGIGMEQMPCGEFEANAMYFAIGVLAYNLAQLLKRRVLPESYRTATVATLRWKLYRLAGKLVRHARGWMLQIKADVEKWRLLESARRRCAALAT